jgi:hypothetical protein
VVIGLIVVLSVGGCVLAVDSGLLALVQTGQPSLLEAELDKLPANERASLNARLDAVVVRLQQSGRDPSEATLENLARQGFARLDDQKLILHLQLQSAVVARIDVGFCGTIAQESIDKTTPTSLELAAMFAALQPDELDQWLNLSVSAAEAELAGTPPRRSVASTEQTRVLQEVFARMDARDLDALAAATDRSTPVTSSDLCHAVVSMYRASLTLPPVDEAEFSLMDVAL